MDQYPFKFTLHLCIGDLYELMEMMKNHPNRDWDGVIQDLYKQLDDQIKKELGVDNE